MSCCFSFLVAFESGRSQSAAKRALRFPPQSASVMASGSPFPRLRHLQIRGSSSQRRRSRSRQSSLQSPRGFPPNPVPLFPFRFDAIGFQTRRQRFLQCFSDFLPIYSPCREATFWLMRCMICWRSARWFRCTRIGW